MATKGIQVELLLGGVMDDGDVALAGGKVFTYVAGTLTNKTTWTDRDKTTPATNPVILDAAGKATIFADGVYKFVIKDSDDVTIRTIDNLEFGFSFTGIVNFSKGIDIASASALTIGTDGNYFDITGTTAITSINAVGVGTVIKLHFDDILTLTHDATNLILPGNANITTAAGDEAEFIEYATGDWICTNYQKTNGLPVNVFAKGADVVSEAALFATANFPADGNYLDVTDTNSITSIITSGHIGSIVKLHFDGALTLTHDATDLILPGGANITTAAGDEAEFIEYASGDWRCINYTRASDSPGSLTNPVLNGNISGTAFLDEDNMASNSSVKVASQQSIKAYTDGLTGSNISVSQSEIQSNAVGQAQLKDALQQATTGGAGNATYTFTGGAYTLGWSLGGGTGHNIDGHTTAGYAWAVRATGGSDSSYFQARYFTASEPYNLGNGDIPLFVFVGINNATGKISRIDIAEAPPWFYRGRPENTFNPKKYKRKPKIIDKKSGRVLAWEENFFYDRQAPLPDKAVDFEAYLDAIANPQYEEIEITPDIKNLDMDIIPHPFLGNDLVGESIVLLDPVGSMAETMRGLYDMGESVADLLMDRYLLIDNEDAGAISPVGVKTHEVKWKKT